MPRVNHLSLRTRVGNILMSPECQAIDFTLAGVHIDGSGFSYIALCLIPNEDSTLGLDFVINPGMNKKHAAEYRPWSNEYVFRNENVGVSLEDQIAIVHESTHALIDARKKSITKLTNEACAYIAGAAYNANQKKPGNFGGPIWSEAAVVAARMARIRKEFRYTDNFNLDGDDVNALRYAILGSDVYGGPVNLPFSSYGESGVDLTPQYGPS